MKKIRFLFLVLCYISVTAVCYSQEVIRLYAGKAPGSENWTWKEQMYGSSIVMDVVDPTLTAFVPSNPNGIAVIVAPGGAFHFLSFENEGTAVAKLLNEKGITAFVLKYRVTHEDPAHPYFSRIMKTKDTNEAFRILDSASAPVIPLMLHDGLTAVKYVREHAASYKIDTGKIGFMGFSAGGTVTMLVAYNGSKETHPNFITPIYGYAGLVKGGKIPTERTPIFDCAASDDGSIPPAHSLQFYTNWLGAKQPAELHMYRKGGHGFGATKQNLPSDAWLNEFLNWVSSIYPAAK